MLRQALIDTMNQHGQAKARCLSDMTGAKESRVKGFLTTLERGGILTESENEDVYTRGPNYRSWLEPSEWQKTKEELCGVMDNCRMDLARALVAWMKDNGATYGDLSKRTGVHRNKLRRVCEQGHSLTAEEYISLNHHIGLRAFYIK